MIMDMNIAAVIASLSRKRKVFHSEADFQFALAWEIHELYPDCHIRLEYTPAVIDSTVRIDICVLLKGELIPIELKYLKKRLHYQDGDEIYKLRENGEQDLSRYDFLKDIQRIEYFKQNISNISRGYAILLTNDPAYWKVGSKRVTIDVLAR